MKKFGLAFWFYFKENLTVKWMLVYGAIFLAVVGGAWALDFFSGRTTTYAVVNESASFALDASMLELESREFIFFESEEEARTALDAGDVEEVFVVTGEETPGLRVITNAHELFPGEVQRTITSVLQQMQMGLVMVENDISPEVISTLFDPIEVDFVTTSEVTEEDFMAGFMAQQIMPLILYIGILMCGSAIANGIVGEKSSRVMEIMVAKLHPTAMMNARIWTATAEFLLMIGCAFAGAVVAHFMGFLDLAAIFGFVGELFSPYLLVMALLIFVFGYFMYMFIFAAVGSMATSLESLNSAIGPIITLIIIPYFAAAFLNPGHFILNILVYFPPFTPFIIVQRYIMGYSSVLELGIALGGMVLFTGVVIFFAGRAYINGISKTSEKITLKDWVSLLAKN